MKLSNRKAAERHGYVQPGGSVYSVSQQCYTQSDAGRCAALLDGEILNKMLKIFQYCQTSCPAQKSVSLTWSAGIQYQNSPVSDVENYSKSENVKIQLDLTATVFVLDSSY